MLMCASAVLHNNISARSELSPFSRWLSLLHAHSKTLQNLKMIPKQVPVVEANWTDKVDPKARKDRLAQYQEKVERIVHCLRQGKHRDGFTKNQQRVFCGQAKNYILDETSDVFYNNYRNS